MLKKVWCVACCLLAAYFFSFNFIPQSSQSGGLPDRVYLKEGASTTLNIGLPLTAKVSTANASAVRINGEEVEQSTTVDLSQPITIENTADEETTLTFSLGGIVPLKNIALKSEEEKELIAGGHNVGVALYTRGALVVGTAEITAADGKSVNPSEIAGLQVGDVILKAAGEEVQNADHLEKIINGAQEEIPMEILREGERMEITVHPVRDSLDNKYRVGLWVRDSTAGIGTMTFYDEETNKFGSLGHAITDADTQTNLLIKSGEIVTSTVVDVIKGAKGAPGELCGNFFTGSKTLGKILQNTEFGIFGDMYEPLVNEYFPEGFPVGYQDSVQLGPAKLLTTIDGNKIEEFDCEIIRISHQKYPASKGMIVKITDERLLQTTGGIVQGMSGSPLIQNGKIIGAVTHVFVNDPQKGYGIFIEWMLQQSIAE